MPLAVAERIVPIKPARAPSWPERLMTSGRVIVNAGQVVTELGSKVDLLVDVVAVDGIVNSPRNLPT